MIKIQLQEAEGQLKQLMEEAASGEEVVITRPDGSSFQIIPLSAPRPRPRFGSAKGQIRMAEDFDEPLDDFKDYEP